MVKEVLIWPHPHLRVVAKPVEDVNDAKVQDVCEQLKETLSAYNAEGVAATQIGSDLRILVILEHEEGEPCILINPVITESQGEIHAFESCVSFPGVRQKILRAETVVVQALDEEGTPVKVALDGVQAVAAQHEVDHLDGKVILDYMSPATRYMAMKQLRKTKRYLRKFK